MASTPPRPRPWEATPPPLIGKAGSYTVFITPPPTPKPSNLAGSAAGSPRTNAELNPGNAAPLPAKASPSPPPVTAPPPFQVPPKQFEKPAPKSPGSVFEFFWDAVSRVQEAHSSLDEYFADWFGLDQSKYQWALNDYYENGGKGIEGGKGGKTKDSVIKGQSVQKVGL